MASLRKKVDGRFYIDYVLGGERKRLPVPDPKNGRATRDPAWAQEFFADWERDVFLPAVERVREDKAGAPVAVASLEQLVKWYLTNYLPGRVRLSSIELSTACLRHLTDWAKANGVTEPESLTAGAVDSFRGYLVGKDLSATRVHIVMQVLRSCVRAGINMGKVSEVNIASWPKTQSQPKERHVLSEAELTAFITQALESKYGDAMVWQALTGMRTSDVLGLKRSSIQGNVLTLRQIKSGSPLTRRLSPELLAIVQRQPKRGPLVFTLSNGRAIYPCAYKREFVAVRDACGLPLSVCPKMLRHTFATLMARRRVNWQVISKLLGHTDPTVTFRMYQHSSLDDQAEATDWLESQVLRP